MSLGSDQAAGILTRKPLGSSRLGSLWLRLHLSQKGEENVYVSFPISVHCIYEETAFVT